LQETALGFDEALREVSPGDRSTKTTGYGSGAGVYSYKTAGGVR
jgi:hypothetical protein